MSNSKIDTVESETNPLSCDNEHPPNKKSILRCSIPAITLLLHLLLICGTAVSVYILLNKIDNLESKITATIRNNTGIASDSELITNGTNKIMNGLLQENSTTQYNKNYLKIINQTEWEAADSTGQLNRLNRPVGMVIIAHTDTLECEDFDSCKHQVKMLQLFYIQLRNFENIGYNFLIGGDGVVYEGIGWEYVGFHTRGHNDNSIGIGFIGNYQNKTPTKNQLSAAVLLLNYGLENNYLDKNYVIKGQRDFLPIVSPGNNLYNRIKKWEHFFKRDGVKL